MDDQGEPHYYYMDRSGNPVDKDDAWFRGRVQRAAREKRSITAQRIYGYTKKGEEIASLFNMDPEEPFEWADKLFKNENFFGSFGIGVRIRNESLVFRTIQLRIAYFPRRVGDMSRWDIELNSKDPSAFDPVGIGKPSIIGFE